MNPYAGRVLVIDDDGILRELCALILRGAGFGVETLANALAAQDLLERVKFDLIILDVFMPGLDGLSLLERMRAQGDLTPILLMSGHVTVQDAARAMRLGVRGLLLKPFPPEDLRTTALEIVGERRMARSQDRAAALRPALRVGERLLGELDLPRLQDQIIATVRAELDADRASLMLIEDNGDWLQIAACSGLPEHVRVGHRTLVHDSLAGRVALRRQPVRIMADGEVSPPTGGVRGELFEDEIVSALSVPVLAGDRVLGVLNAAKVRNSPPFSEADQELLLLLAAQAAIAIENARLYSAVAQSEARYRALLHHANDAVLLLDAEGQAILDANLASAKLSGYSVEELLALAPRQLLPALDNLLATAQRNGQGHEIETELQTRQEHATPIAASVSMVPHAGEQLLLVIARDTSERQRIAKQLVQAEKLAALGRLSASLAHEINNPLQAIHNSVHLLLSRPLPEEKQQTYLKMTQEEIERLISIVQRMLDFYRPSRDGMRPTEVNELLDAVLPLIESQALEQGVRIVRKSSPRLPRVLAISNHLKQVCFNLIFNAVEAMPEGGDLRVRTYLTSEDLPDPEEASYGAVAGGRGSTALELPAVVIEISDSGAGIAPQDLPKIFEPFYTTRTKGTGLGLAVSYSIIEQHHGELAVRSQLGVGTTFRIRLPVAM
ncbi:MAG: response regulator [Candidatus Viridilinea halotolerans]|uniref:histidine kinase n=1 Tax=Candidatus Viridilinea halotolerans TaxID=2491704 RepID=A0A426UC66_9CHLR|nr:MAG: response regulator [Candidatus Viridilinea halotolerans]